MQIIRLLLAAKSQLNLLKSHSDSYHFAFCCDYVIVLHNRMRNETSYISYLTPVPFPSHLHILFSVVGVTFNCIPIVNGPDVVKRREIEIAYPNSLHLVHKLRSMVSKFPLHAVCFSNVCCRRFHRVWKLRRNIGIFRRNACSHYGDRLGPVRSFVCSTGNQLLQYLEKPFDIESPNFQGHPHRHCLQPHRI